MGYFLFFIIAIYAAMYGAMYATFLSYVLIMFFGLTFLESAGTRKLFGVVRYVLTVPILIIAGKVVLPFMINMFIARSIGAYIGSHYADKIGNKAIRWMFIGVTLIAVIKMFF